ncbi:E3 ubiquitin-protein ligase makorin [Camellia lanceoleosa]|uniref:E3 ubiquitin-protein ligase makorin n=1 Tax=Camellia lanceoleosa TaxID=1840588 RepID=A0ACC0H3G7_9ERIC|nr:E3 ubiquitin-protein ligase makorin [Camellia lanceoleosa]KAI8007685.1 E3 ubiquitin-protein ligase makorin [Camellia lanceoleosa]
MEADADMNMLKFFDHSPPLNWHSSSPTSGMDVNSTLRACPICRKVSYFVIPSVIWYSTKEEKQEIVDSYKAKLR